MKLFKPSDVVFTLAVIASALLVWFYLQAAPEGERVVVTLNGAQIASLPLDQDTEFVVRGAYTNVLEIKDGSAYIKETDCPNKVCQKEGSIRKTGQTIVCAPNKMTATVTGGKGGDVDAVTK